MLETLLPVQSVSGHHPTLLTIVAAPPPEPAVLDPMGALWHNQFHLLFDQFWPSTWRLVPRPLVPGPTNDWHVHADAAKVRFLCQVCGHGWTSMKGRVVLWFKHDVVGGCGTVAFSLFGQQCQQCRQRGQDNFTPAMWYQEEVVKVLYNVFHSVGRTFYGFPPSPYVQARRPGKPRTRHPADLCQACQLGLCAATDPPRTP